MKLLLFLFSFFFCAFSLLAEDGLPRSQTRGLKIPSFELRFPDSEQGKYATVFFVSANKGILPTGSSIPLVNYVLKKLAPIYIDASLNIRVENLLIPKVNARNFNYIYILTHAEQKDVYIKNPDQTCPDILGQEENPCELFKEEKTAFEYDQGYAQEYKRDAPMKRSANDLNSWQRLR